MGTHLDREVPQPKSRVNPKVLALIDSVVADLPEQYRIDARNSLVDKYHHRDSSLHLNLPSGEQLHTVLYRKQQGVDGYFWSCEAYVVTHAVVKSISRSPTPGYETRR